MDFFDIDPRFRSPLVEERRLKKLSEEKQQYKLKLPENTLRNSDGTPYSANNPVNEPARIVRVRVDEPEDEEERRLHAELYGHAPLACEVEYQGKIYAGTLYFDRNAKK